MLYQPLVAGFAGFSVALIVGAVLSMLMPLFVTLAVLPAWSLTLFMTLWLAPSPKTMSSGQAPESPDRASEQVKLTVTFSLFQPLALASGLRAAAMVGAVLSIKADTERVVELPATSETVLVTTVGVSASADSAEAVSVKPLLASKPWPGAKPEPPSEAVKLRGPRGVLRQVVLVTSSGVMPGAVVSTLKRYETAALEHVPVALNALAHTVVSPWPRAGAAP